MSLRASVDPRPDAPAEGREQSTRTTAARSAVATVTDPADEVSVPLCVTGIGPDEPCADGCSGRKQPMCGGHTSVERIRLARTAEGRAWLARTEDGRRWLEGFDVWQRAARRPWTVPGLPVAGGGRDG